MERSIPQAEPATAPGGLEARPRELRRELGLSLRPWQVGLAIVALCLAVFVASNPNRYNFYEHFVWQAQAWLQGETSIPIGVKGDAATPANDYYQDVMPITDAQGHTTGRGILPFPPLPAVVLLPFVAVWGLWTNEQLLSAFLGAVDVGIAFWMLGALPIRPGARAAAALFLGLGTVLWYAAMLGSTWFFAHVVAVGCLLLAIGVALRADPTAADPAIRDDRGLGARMRSWLPGGLADAIPAALPLDGRQVLAGFLFGLAVTARLTILLGFPFFVLVGGGRGWLRRGVSAGIGAAVPVAVLLLYTYLATGSPFNPAYDYQYHRELGYSGVVPGLDYNGSWSIEDLRYVPQNILIMLTSLPTWLPSTVNGTPTCVAGEARSLFGLSCPYAVPQQVGTSLLLTSPAYLLGIAAFVPGIRRRLSRVSAGALIAVGLIAFVNLMHFSQGWVQFGYRFSNDFAPFALVLVGLGIDALRRPSGRVVAGLLIASSIAANLWGVVWGVTLGW